MNGYNDYSSVGQESVPTAARRIMPANPIERASYGNDIEVIDLDNSRDYIKPTTWHLN